MMGGRRIILSDEEFLSLQELATGKKGDSRNNPLWLLPGPETDEVRQTPNLKVVGPNPTPQPNLNSAESPTA
jgi:hypothetical protein